MIGGKRIVAVVPARGGSKSVPRKNIKPLAGRPLIAWTADQLAALPELDRAVLSTEDAEIKAVAEGCGFQVLDRPAELATDAARTEPVLLQVLDALAARGEEFDYLLCLEPTSPLRRVATIRAAMEAFVASGAPSLVAVTPVKDFLGEIEDGFFRPYWPNERGRRQDMKPRYRVAGTLFACTVAHLRATRELMAADWFAWPVDGDDLVDINTPDDFDYADFLMRKRP
jgi:N-acylneuraminate cytidylyltransferase